MREVVGDKKMRRKEGKKGSRECESESESESERRAYTRLDKILLQGREKRKSREKKLRNYKSNNKRINRHN